MKPLAPFLLLFLLRSYAVEAAGAVLDSDGKAVTRGAEYYVIPIPGSGGGLGLAPRNETCPLFVVKASSGVDIGHPITFFPVDEDEDSLKVSTDTNIAFSSTATICVQSTVWKLQNDEEATGGRLYVAIGGVTGKPGRETLSNWFQVEKVHKGIYKFVFCPQVCNFCRPLCGDLGLRVEDGKAWLGYGGSPFSVIFKKKVLP